jgi:hypothetical protein
MKYIELSTPYGDYYIIREDGCITHNHYGKEPQFSGQWKVEGIRHVIRTNDFIPLTSLFDPSVINRITWLFKNGHPQWTIEDRDHGTSRRWGNTNVHGIRGMTLVEK